MGSTDFQNLMGGLFTESGHLLFRKGILTGFSFEQF